MNVKFKKLDPKSITPQFQNYGDVCADLSSIISITIAPRTHSVVPTGIAIGLELGWEAQIRPRSGLAAKNGISILNSPGTIDSGYRGEIKIILMNNTDSPFTVKNGDRIAQIAIREVPFITFEEVENLDTTERGANGFGSTGIATLKQES